MCIITVFNMRKSIESACKVLKSQEESITEAKNDNSNRLLNQSIYFVNKSKSKYICIGLLPYATFAPMVEIVGVKNQRVTFDETEWGKLLELQGLIIKYFHTTESEGQTFNIINAKKISFTSIKGNKILKIEDQGSEVYLALETFNELFDLLEVIKYRIELLKNEQFCTFYNNILVGVADIPGDVVKNILNVLSTLKDTNSQTIIIMMELLKFFPERVRVDFELSHFEVERSQVN